MKNVSAVPFVVSYPDLIKEPRVESRFVLNIDLAPTIADLAGVEIPSTVDGISFVPLLDGSATGWRDAILFEHWQLADGFGGVIPDFSGIRTDQWKYVAYSTGESELYDLYSDPYEMDNLAGFGEYEEIMNDLYSRLEAMKDASGFDEALRGKDHEFPVGRMGTATR